MDVLSNRIRCHMSAKTLGHGITFLIFVLVATVSLAAAQTTAAITAWAAASTTHFARCDGSNASFAGTIAAPVSEAACRTRATELAAAASPAGTPAYVISADRTLCVALGCAVAGRVTVPDGTAAAAPDALAAVAPGLSLRYVVPAGVLPLCTRAASCSGAGAAYRWPAGAAGACVCVCDDGLTGAACDQRAGLGASSVLRVRMSSSSAQAAPSASQLAAVRTLAASTANVSQTEVAVTAHPATGTSALRELDVSFTSAAAFDRVSTPEAAAALGGNATNAYVSAASPSAAPAPISNVTNNTTMNATTNSSVRRLSRQFAAAQAAPAIDTTTAPFVAPASLARVSLANITSAAIWATTPVINVTLTGQAPLAGATAGMESRAYVQRVVVTIGGASVGTLGASATVSAIGSTGNTIFTGLECVLQTAASEGCPAAVCEVVVDAPDAAAVTVTLPALATRLVQGTGCPAGADVAEVAVTASYAVSLPTLSSSTSVETSTDGASVGRFIVVIIISLIALFIFMYAMAREARLSANAEAAARSIARIVMLLLLVACIWPIVIFAFSIASLTALPVSQSHVVVGFSHWESACAASTALSPLPRRVLLFPDTDDCSEVGTIGASGLPLFAEAKCNPQDGTVELKIGGTKGACKDASTQTLSQGACLSEAAVFGSATGSAAYFVAFGCASSDDATALSGSAGSITGSGGAVRSLPATTTVVGVPTEDRAFGTAGTTVLSIGGTRTATGSVQLGSSQSVAAPAVPLFSPTDAATTILPAALSAAGIGTTAVSANSEQPLPVEEQPTELSPFALTFDGAAASATVRGPWVQGTGFDIGDIRGDDGSLAPEFTITFWLRTATDTRGVVFAVVDDWLVEATQRAPAIDAIAAAVFSGGAAGGGALFPAGTHSVYTAVLADAPARRLHLAFALAGNAPTLLTWEADGDAVPALFDGAWHHVALGSSLQAGNRYLQLFVDGDTSYRANAFRQCMPDTARDIPAVSARAVGGTARVAGPGETVTAGGAVHVGALDGAVFGVEIHNSQLTQQEVAQLGTATMKSDARILTTESRALGGIMIAIALLGFVASLAHSGKEIYQHRAAQQEKEDEGEQQTATQQAKKGKAVAKQGAGAAAGAGKAGANTAQNATASSSNTSNALLQLAVIIPAMNAVVQSMMLYFQGWQWPIEFEAPFTFAFFAFSFDLALSFPSIPVGVTYGLQFAVALIGLVLLYVLARRDTSTYSRRVLLPMRDAKAEGRDPFEDIEDDTLPEPNVKRRRGGGGESDMMTTRGFLGGHEVIGLVSRLAVGMQSYVLAKRLMSLLDDEDELEKTLSCKAGDLVKASPVTTLWVRDPSVEGDDSNEYVVSAIRNEMALFSGAQNDDSDSESSDNEEMKGEEGWVLKATKLTNEELDTIVKGNVLSYKHDPEESLTMSMINLGFIHIRESYAAFAVLYAMRSHGSDWGPNVIEWAKSLRGPLARLQKTRKQLNDAEEAMREVERERRAMEKNGSLQSISDNNRDSDDDDSDSTQDLPSAAAIEDAQATLAELRERFETLQGQVVAAYRPYYSFASGYIGFLQRYSPLLLNLVPAIKQALKAAYARLALINRARFTALFDSLIDSQNLRIVAAELVRPRMTPDEMVASKDVNEQYASWAWMLGAEAGYGSNIGDRDGTDLLRRHQLYGTAGDFDAMAYVAATVDDATKRRAIRNEMDDVYGDNDLDLDDGTSDDDDDERDSDDSASSRGSAAAKRPSGPQRKDMHAVGGSKAWDKFVYKTYEADEFLAPEERPAYFEPVCPGGMSVDEHHRLRDEHAKEKVESFVLYRIMLLMQQAGYPIDNDNIDDILMIMHTLRSDWTDEIRGDNDQDPDVIMMKLAQLFCYGQEEFVDVRLADESEYTWAYGLPGVAEAVLAEEEGAGDDEPPPEQDQDWARDAIGEFVRGHERRLEEFAENNKFEYQGPFPESMRPGDSYNPEWNFDTPCDFFMDLEEGEKFVPHWWLQGQDMIEAYIEAREDFDEQFVNVLREAREAQELANEYNGCSVVTGRIEVRRTDTSLRAEDIQALVRAKEGEDVRKHFEFVFRPVRQDRSMFENAGLVHHISGDPYKKYEDGIMRLPLEVLPPRRCPVHRQPLMNAMDEHKRVKARVDHAYECALDTEERRGSDDPGGEAYNEWWKPASQKIVGCNPIDFYVCQDRHCNFSICANCMQFATGKEKAVARAASIKYRLNRIGAVSIIGLIMLTLTQSMYLPAIRNAVAAVFCHSSLACEYPTCYSPATAAYLALSLASGLILLFVGIGFIVFLFAFVVGRKYTLLTSGIFDPEDVEFPGCHDHEDQSDGNNKERKAVVRPSSAGAESTASNDSSAVAEAAARRRRLPRRLREVIFSTIAQEKWAAILARDESMFKGAYQQYEFLYMAVHGPLMVFKLLQLGVVLYAGEPNSLTQLSAASVVEVVQMLILTVANPFTDPWIDALVKVGAVHQVGQLGLMGLFRADVAEDPTRRGAAYAMITVAVLYFILVIVVITFVVIVPIYSAWKRGKEEREAEAKRVEEALKAARGDKKDEADDEQQNAGHREPRRPMSEPSDDDDSDEQPARRPPPGQRRSDSDDDDDSWGDEDDD